MKRRVFILWAAVAAALAVLWADLPYLIGYIPATPSNHFGGFFLYEQDGYSYLAKMRQGAQEAWDFHLPYTSEDEYQTGGFVYDDLAHSFLNAPLNPNGRPNSDVVFRWLSGKSSVGEDPGKWIIYFGDMSQQAAALYERPFEYVRNFIYPERQKNNEERARIKWWQHRRPASEMREAVTQLNRYIATPRHAKHRIFVWAAPSFVPDDGVYVFAREDDYFFDVLHSTAHELWARATGTQLREAESGFRYTPTTTFENFPLPWPPGQEDQSDVRVIAIAQAAKELNGLRDAWLNPPGISDGELKKRTLTNLYNARPTWLDNAHRKLDAAVFAAYSWPSDLSDDEILARLLALNLERASRG